MYLYLDAAAEGVKPWVIFVWADLPLRLFDRGTFQTLAVSDW